MAIFASTARLRRLAFAAAGASCSFAALAHDLWLAREQNAFVLYQGHRHSAHEGQEIVPYPATAVSEAICLDGKGSLKAVRYGSAHPVRVDADCAAVPVAMSSGYWTKTVWETRNVPKTGISGVVQSWLAEETVKRVERWIPAAAIPMSPRLEITPLVDPWSLAPGDKLRLRVSFAGQPVAYAGEVRGTTGDDGSIALRLRHPGMQLISTSVELPLADGKADRLIRTSALNFELPAR